MNKREIVCYETDASRIKGSVEKVFFPESIDEVISIVKGSKIDIVPRGSGTNLVGGCVPSNSIVVDVSKMNKVTNLLPLRKTVRVEAGITLKELNEKLNPLGFEFPIDTSNHEISTLGGMIATNATGDRSMRYGSVKDWIEEIEFVNGKGELSKTSKADIGDVCGMEGITGIIVAATIKLASLIKRSASVFQSESIDEVLSVARKLRSEKEVVILELFSPNVSKLLGLPEKYNLIIEFNSERGKIKDKEYLEISELRKNVFYKLFSEGYYNVSDPKFFFDKIKEFILFLEENEIPYVGHLGVGIIHPFFMDKDKWKIEKVMEFVKKIKANPGKFGIGITRKYFIDSFQAKLIQRIKIRHDPLYKFNKGKVIDIFLHTFPKIKKEKDEEKNSESREAEISENLKIDDEDLIGEKISAIEVVEDSNGVSLDKTPEEKMEDFIKEIESRDKILEKKGEEEKSEEEKQKLEVKERLKDYEETFKSELGDEKVLEVEKFAKNIPREIVKKEKVDYNKIRDIMTNKLGKTNNNESVDRGKVKVEDNFEELKTINPPSSPSLKTPGLGDFDRKNNLSDEDKDLINKIIGNRAFFEKETSERKTGKEEKKNDS